MTQKLYFLALDKAGKYDLWTTDGTTTAAVGGIGDVGVAGSSSDGLGPSSLTVFGQQMIFAGEDGLNNTAANGIWLTDGTVGGMAGGTTEVGGVSPGPNKSLPYIFGNPSGLDPTDFVTFGSKAIFSGTDAMDFTGLWVTDGTESGTIELGGLENGQIAGKGASLTAEHFFALGNSVLFDAIDASGFTGLWVSDGTTAGTAELGGSRNQAIFDSGLSKFEANNFIELGSLALFSAEDKQGNESLWVTDGTASGTTELGGPDNAQIAGADNVGLGGGLQYAVRFGARVLFSGADTGGDEGLWVTDGTALGTLELGGLGDTGLTSFGQHPSLLGLRPSDLTVNGQKVLFDGEDALGFQELWVSDGTTVGTYEIGGEGTGGELANEAGDGVNPTSIVSLGNGKAVFIGDEKTGSSNSGKPTLWVTDGTFAGTTEVGGPDNQGVFGVYSLGFDFTSGIVGGSGLAYFVAEDAAGHTVLWETDGTVGGTKVAAATDGNAPSTGLSASPASLTMGPVPALVSEIDGGGKSVNLDNIPGETVDLSGTSNVFDTVTGDNGLVNLSAAQAVLIGGGLAAVMTGASNAVSLFNTHGNKDSVYGSKGAVTLNGAQANVIGFENNITFAANTTGNVVYLSDTKGLWDTVTGSNGTIYLTSAQTSVTGGSDTIYFAGGSDDQVSLYSTNGAWDTVNGSSGQVIVNAAQASVVGGYDVITETAGATISLYNTTGHWDTVNATSAAAILNGAQASVTGGANTITETAGSTVSLYGTNNNWDQVNATAAYVLLTSAQAQVTGGGDFITANAGSQASLTGTGGNYDTFNGAGDTLILTNAQVSVVGGADTLYENGASSAASLYNTNGAWDSVFGTGASVTLVSSQALVTGGGEAIYETGAASVSIKGTSGNWDTVKGSGATDIIAGAQASIVGGGNVIWLSGGSSVSLYSTNGAYDTVEGSSQTVLLTNAQASIVGGGNQIHTGGASAISLYSTAGVADAVVGSGMGMTLVSAQASLTGSSDFVSFSGANALAVNGASEAFSFAQTMGTSSITGFQASDAIHLSALDWTSFSALQSSGALKANGSGNAVITLNASNALTLVGVQASALTSAQFSFA